MIGSYSRLQRSFNKLNRSNISGAVVELYAHEERVANTLGIEVEQIMDNEKRVDSFTARIMELEEKEKKDKKKEEE